MDKKLTNEVKEYAKNLGADLVGFAPVSRYEGAPEMLAPQAHLPEAKTVISIAIHHPDASVEWGGEPNPNFPGPFQIGMIPKLDAISFRVSKFLEKEGYNTIPFGCTFYWRHRHYKNIPYDHAATFSHMTAFAAAGLGEYGRHGMVMSPEFGPRQRLVSLITSAELAPDALYGGKPLCDRCGMCEKHCPGNNYEKDKLLNPEYIEFEIEGKKFKYPNINRWRCFYGEQTHLDMNVLAELDDMTEDKIYESLEKGVKRIEGHGAAGYCCASLKYCMPPSVRKWDLRHTPGPRRKKGNARLDRSSVLKKIEDLARNAGADRIIVQPLRNYENCRNNFHQGFRTEEFFDNFDRLITFGRRMPDFGNCSYVADRNNSILKRMVSGRMMMAALDISGYLDNAGIEATQDWPATGISKRVADGAGWNNDGDVVAGSVICRIDLPDMEKKLSLPRQNGKLQIDHSLPFMELIDEIGIVALDKIHLPEIENIRKTNPDFKSLIVLLTGMPARMVELAGRQKSEDSSSYAFINYQIIRETLSAAHDLSDFLQDRGFRALPAADLTENSYPTLSSSVGQYIPDLRASAPFAASAGLGEIGLNGMLLTPEFGPRQRFSFVLTTAELQETGAYRGGKLCKEGCRLCAESCPVNALNKSGKSSVNIGKNLEYDVFERHENRCAWARHVGMVREAGSGLLGWKIPEMPVPEELTDESIQKALEAKDPIQRICYKNPNHSDIVIERCLQVCPAGKKKP